jgi:hypothetical protein
MRKMPSQFPLVSTEHAAHPRRHPGCITHKQKQLTSAAVASCVSTLGLPLAFLPSFAPSSALLLVRDRFLEGACPSDSELVMVVLVCSRDILERDTIVIGPIRDRHGTPGEATTPHYSTMQGRSDSLDRQLLLTIETSLENWRSVVMAKRWVTQPLNIREETPTSRCSRTPPGLRSSARRAGRQQGYASAVAQDKKHPPERASTRGLPSASTLKHAL